MNVLVTRTGNTYAIYNADTGEEVGHAANDLNLRLQCQARGWVCLNMPRRSYHRKGVIDAPQADGTAATEE